MMIFRLFIAITFPVMAVFVEAQVEIIDRALPTAKTSEGDSVKAEPSVSSGQLSEMYYNMQILQQEVQQLRGTVEQLDYQVKQLKQQRLDDYLDLDRRLSRVGQSSSNTPSNTSSTGTDKTNHSSVVTPVVPSVSVADSASAEISTYRKAMDLVLKQKEYDKGAEALIAFLERFPSGRYAGNAQYWLGEIYLQKDDLANAQKWFSTLVSIFPSHSKVMDAKFKLGKVYFKLGDTAKAKTFLEEVAASNTSTAGLAQDFLSDEF